MAVQLSNIASCKSFTETYISRKNAVMSLAYILPTYLRWYSRSVDLYAFASKPALDRERLRLCGHHGDISGGSALHACGCVAVDVIQHFRGDGDTYGYTECCGIPIIIGYASLANWALFRDRTRVGALSGSALVAGCSGEASVVMRPVRPLVVSALLSLGAGGSVGGAVCAISWAEASVLTIDLLARFSEGAPATACLR